MSARRSRLDAVLRIRRLQEEAERGRLLLAQHEVTSAAAVVVHRTASYDALEPRSPEATATAFLADQARRTLVADAVLGARRDEEAAGDRAAVAQVSWSSAAREVDGVERLVDRARHLRLVEMIQVEQQATDEAALARRVTR